ncbi:MAG: TetR/AcrR family transcriptional regulator [Clostridiales bacterium]
MRIKRPNKKKEQAAETRKKLYDSARSLFIEKDFASVGVEDITDAAGITKGAFHVHFESKDALIALIIADYAAQADMDYKSFLEALPDHMPADEVFLALIAKIADVLTGTIGYENMKKVYQMLLAGTVDTEAVKGYGREFYLLFQDVLNKGIRQGKFKNSLPVDEIARHLVMAIRGVSYEWCIRYPGFDLKEQATAHFKLLLEGLKTNQKI